MGERVSCLQLLRCFGGITQVYQYLAGLWLQEQRVREAPEGFLRSLRVAGVESIAAQGADTLEDGQKRHAPVCIHTAQRTA